jgi:hypothetical protein
MNSAQWIWLVIRRFIAECASGDLLSLLAAESAKRSPTTIHTGLADGALTAKIGRY